MSIINSLVVSTATYFSSCCSFLILVVLSTPSFSAEQTRISGFARYSGFAPKIFDEWVRENRYVEVRDGVRLATTIYRPAENGVAVTQPFPVVFSLTPYRRLYEKSDGRLTGLAEGERPGDPVMADLTHYGYVVVVADVRGKGASFGVRWAYQDENEARDGYDLVEWLGTRPWSDGNVGMFGCSYYAGTQLATARKSPSYLKALFVQAGPFDAYEMVRRGGIAGQFNTRYQSSAEDIGVIPVDEDPSGKLAEMARQQHAANGQMLDMITQLPYRDDRDPQTDIPYWELVSPHKYLKRLNEAGLAFYFWGNWYDEIADQTLLSFANLTGEFNKAYIGSGTHCDTVGIDLFAEHHRFFDRFLKGIDNGIEKEPPLLFDVMHPEKESRLQSANQWPLQGIRHHTYYLSNSADRLSKSEAFENSLSLLPDEPGELNYEVNYDVECQVPEKFMPGVGKPKPGEETKPQPGYWPCVLDDIGATFTTAAFDNTKTLAGAPVVNLVLSSTEDANVFAYLEMVSPEDEVTIISHGRLKLSNRALSDPPFDNLGQPWHSNKREDVKHIETGTLMEVAISLSPTAIDIPKGWRLRLTLTGADLRQRNLAQIKRSPPPVLSMKSGLHGSHIVLPLVL